MIFLFPTHSRISYSGAMRRRCFCGIYGVLAALAGFLASTSVMAAPIERNPTAVTGGATSEKRPPEVLDAIKRYEGGDAEKAFELLKAAGAKYPNLSPPRVMFANIYFSDRQKAAGLRQLEIAIVEAPDDPEAHLIFGDIAVFERRVSDAEAQYEAGRSLLSRFTGDAKRKAALSAQCQLGLASVAKMRGKWDIAAKQISQLLETQPDNATARQRLAEALLANGKPDDALKQLEAAVKANDKLPPSAMLMADLYRQMGKTKEAVEWLTRAEQEAPKDLRVRLGMADYYFGDGQLDKASSEFDAAAKIDPQSIEAKIGRGMVARFRGDLVTARKELEAVLEKAPSNLAASNQLILIAADENDDKKLAKALDLAIANLKSMPQNPEAEATLGWVCFKLGRIDEAERHLQAATAAGVVSRDTGFYLAKLLYARGQRGEALDFLRKAVEGRGPFAHADDARKWLATQSTNGAPQK